MSKTERPSSCPIKIIRSASKGKIQRICDVVWGKKREPKWQIFKCVGETIWLAKIGTEKVEVSSSAVTGETVKLLVWRCKGTAIGWGRWLTIGSCGAGCLTLGDCKLSFETSSSSLGWLSWVVSPQPRSRRRARSSGVISAYRSAALWEQSATKKVPMWVHTIPLLNPSLPSSESTRQIQLIAFQNCIDQAIPRIWSILLSEIIICWELISRRRNVWVLFYSIGVLVDRHQLVIVIYDAFMSRSYFRSPLLGAHRSQPGLNICKYHSHRWQQRLSIYYLPPCRTQFALLAPRATPLWMKFWLLFINPFLPRFEACDCDINISFRKKKKPYNCLPHSHAWNNDETSHRVLW